MSSAYAIFERFNDPVLARQMSELMKERGIDHVLEDASPVFDPMFTSNRELLAEYQVKLKPADFAKARELFLQLSGTTPGTIDPGHYLLAFTDTELLEVVAKPDEWGMMNYNIAMQILKNRGKEPGPQLLQEMQGKHLKELAEPNRNQDTLILWGYILACVGVVPGLFIGFMLISYRKTLPDGKTVWAFSEADRSHGKKILLLCFFSIVLILIYQTLKSS